MPTPGKNDTKSRPKPKAAFPISFISNPSRFTSDINWEAVDPAPKAAATGLPPVGIAATNAPKSAANAPNCHLSAAVKSPFLIWDVVAACFSFRVSTFGDDFSVSLDIQLINPPVCCFGTCLTYPIAGTLLPAYSSLKNPAFSHLLNADQSLCLMAFISSALK